MKEYSPTPSVDWTAPENKADQHRIRYMDQSLHLIFADTEKAFNGTGVGVDGVLLPKELKRLRNHTLFNRRQNFIDTGGDKAMIDANIQFGAQAEVTDTDTGIRIISKKL